MLNILRHDPPNIQSCNNQFEMNKIYSSRFEKFLANCLQRVAENRKDINELLDHTFIKYRKDATYLIDKVVRCCDLDGIVYEDCLPESLMNREQQQIRDDFDTDIFVHVQDDQQ